MLDPRTTFFDAARAADADNILVLDDLNKIHAVLDLAGVPRMAVPQLREINQAGFDLIKYFEGCKLIAYKDIAGVWTIGWGHTGADVTPGMTITQQQADAMLDRDLDEYEAAVHRYAGQTTDNQFAALTSFAYNVGIGALRKSTLLKRHLAGDFKGAANQFVRWNKARVGGVLRSVKGLTRRRLAEADLYRRAI